MLHQYKKAKANIREKLGSAASIIEYSGAFENKPGDTFTLDPSTVEFCKAQFTEWFDREIKEDLELISK